MNLLRFLLYMWMKYDPNNEFHVKFIVIYHFAYAEGVLNWRLVEQPKFNNSKGSQSFTSIVNDESLYKELKNLDENVATVCNIL